MSFAIQRVVIFRLLLTGEIGLHGVIFANIMHSNALYCETEC